jgi:putative nucleotidyltransferase with HDIG domain
MSGGDLRLSEVLGALSYALDITEGQPLGHAVRSCLIGMRLAEEIDLPAEERSALFYALLLKDLGCSSNAARVTSLFGTDDIDAKRTLKVVDWSRYTAAGAYALRTVGRESPRAWVRNFARVAKAGPEAARELTQIRCERGADIATMLGLPDGAAEAILTLDEHWDGGGHPAGLRREEIPLLGRVLGLAQTVEVFFTLGGLDSALEVARKRSKRWFDPALVRALERTQDDRRFWDAVSGLDPRETLDLAEPDGFVLLANDERIDRVAHAFARVIDAKSPYTFRHSERVAEIAVAIATELGLSAEEIRDLDRAALLHDIGKLGVSNTILDKAGKLTDEEFARIQRHPEYTQRILERVSQFADIVHVAASHHEKLDGSGYHRGLRAEDLPLPARILTVADIYEAMTAERPYRDGMPVDVALGIMRSDVPHKLCEVAFGALEATQDRLPAPAAL